jgi:hypothetical protein
MSSARSLADLTDEKSLPWDYLTALLLLFVIQVVDRLVYSLGSHLGKALLLLGQLLLFVPLSMSLFWSPVASASTRQHVRVFMLLKSASWVSSALQLRSGFPPRASFDGGGRQRFVFFSRADVWHLTAFYVFQVGGRGLPLVNVGRRGGSPMVECRPLPTLFRTVRCCPRHLILAPHCISVPCPPLPSLALTPPTLQAVPFLYELRALLDWTCSATPLNWYQWLKLEDIRASLFVEECRCALCVLGLAVSVWHANNCGPQRLTHTVTAGGKCAAER